VPAEPEPAVTVALPPADEAVVRRALDVAETALDGLRSLLRAATGAGEVVAKHDGTPVTDADLEADERLSAALQDAFPTHGILSEERHTRAPTTAWTWVIDPIDGTSNFTCGLPYWCVSVALLLHGRPVLGLIDAPVLDRRYRAVAGQGAWLGARRLTVRPTVDWRDGRNRHVPVMLTTATARRSRAAGLRLNPRVMGATALDLAIVAEGVAAASIAIRPRVWDVAAGWLLVEEAGGQVVTIGGEPLLPLQPGVDYGDVTAPTAAGPDADAVRGLAEALLPSPGG
jgi:myo-inositol-1(or 4)-monophosphatase